MPDIAFRLGLLALSMVFLIYPGAAPVCLFLSFWRLDFPPDLSCSLHVTSRHVWVEEGVLGEGCEGWL